MAAGVGAVAQRLKPAQDIEFTWKRVVLAVTPVAVIPEAGLPQIFDLVGKPIYPGTSAADNGAGVPGFRIAAFPSQIEDLGESRVRNDKAEQTVRGELPTLGRRTSHLCESRRLGLRGARGAIQTATRSEMVATKIAAWKTADYRLGSTACGAYVTCLLALAVRSIGP